MAPSRKKAGKGSAAAAAAVRLVWNVGDLVLAKVKGFPAWPARVSKPEDWGRTIDHRKIFVFFFGTKQIGYCNPGDLTPFTPETKKVLLAKSQVKNATTDFCRAVKEICGADESSRLGNVNEEISHSVSEEGAERESDDLRYFEKEKDLKLDDAERKEEDHTMLVFTRHEKEGRLQQSFESGTEEIKIDGCNVEVDNGVVKMEPNIESGGVGLEKHKGKADARVDSDQSKKKRRFGREDHENPGKSTQSASPKSAELPSSKRSSSRLVRSSSEVGEQKEATCRVDGVSLSVKKKRGESRKIFRSPQSQNPEDVDVRAHPTLNHQVTSPSARILDEANYQTRDLQSNKKGRRLVKDHRGFSTAAHPARGMEVQREYLKVESGNDYKHSKSEQEVTLEVSINRQVSEPSDGFEDRVAFKKVPMNFAAHEESGAATPLESDDDASKREIGEAIQHTSLPKKKRRAIRKSERDFNSFSLVEIAKDAVNSANKEVADAVFQEQQAEDTQGKAAAVEYQRRKRGQVSLHTQGHEPPQIVENNKHDRIKHERSIPGSKGNGKVSPKSSTTCNETESIANRQAYHLKRQKTANSEQNLKVAEDRDEQRSPTRVCLETSSVEDTKCRMSTDEHLPLVKRARARFEKEAQVWLHRELDATVLSSEGKHTDQAPENQSRTASVRVEGTLGLLSVFNGSDARDSSRIIVKRDMSLPPKADKYRIRSSLADGEAALPPLKRRQRALEAMTACAAEAATVVEGGTSVSIEGQWQEAPGGSELKMSFAGRGGHEGSNADKMETRVFGAETLHLKDAVPGEANNKSDDFGAETKECGTVADKITSVQPIEKTGEKLVSGLPGDLNLESTEIKLFSENMDTVKLSVKHTDGHICSPKKWEGTKSSLRPGISQQAKVQGSVDLNKGQMEKPVDVKVKGKSKKHGLTLLKETASLPGVSLNHGATVTLIPNEKLGHESTGTYHEHLVKHAVPIPSEVGGTKTVIESINEQGKASDKSNGASTGPRVDSLSSVKLQLDVNANKVREAVEAAKGVKQKISKDGEVSTASMSMKYLIAAAQAKRQVRSAVATSTVTYAEMEKVSTALISSPSPGGSSQLNSPAQTLNMGLYQDFQRTTSGGIRTPDAVPETSQSLGQEYREEGNTGPFKTLSKEDVITVDTEAFIARDTFEGMLETLSRTRESIARATRHALDCAKYGIAEQVVEILVQRLENEPSFHRRVDLFFLVDSITQCSHNLKGPAGAAYPPAVQTALPRLLSAAAPPGNVARENRRQCLKVLKLWLERSIMPESALRSYMIDLESYSHEKTSGMFPRRPSRSERAVDDPIREMEGMYVDEYGSNATFSLPGLLIPRMYEDDEDACDDDKKTGMCISTFPEEREEAATVSPRQIEKHRHILEDVDGELEMEDVSPTSELEESSGKDQFDGALISQDAVFSAGGVGGVASEGEEQSPPLPSEPPPPPPDCPPPSPPPLPASPPPLSPPPPPPPSPPSHFSTSHLLPPLHSYASSSHLGLQAAQFSPLVLQSGMDGNYLISTEQQPVPPTLGTQHISVLTSEEKRFENYYQPQGNLPGIMQQPPQGSAQTLGIEATFSSPSGFMITQTTPRQYAMVSSGGLPPSLNTSHIQALQLGNKFSQTLYRPLQPVQPSNPFSYGSREAVRQSASSPSLEKELASPQVQNVQGEQSCMLQSDSGRRMFEEIQSSRVDGGQILARGHFHGENGDNTQQSIYSTSDLISGLNCGVIRPMPGAQYASNMPSMQIQVRPQAVTGASLGPISNVDMPHPPYTGHAGAVPGGLVMGVGANQTKLSMLACRPGGSAPNSWRPN